MSTGPTSTGPMMDGTARCPCGTGEVYGECCRPRHDASAPAPTAEALMRSRFSAFAVGDAAYVHASWHASTRPATVTLDDGVRWTRLDIVATEGGGPFDRTGAVEFRAHFRDAEGRGVQSERSRFVREGGRWFYLDGDVGASGTMPS